MARPADPRRIDVAAAAADRLHLDGVWPLPALERLASDTLPAEDDSAAVTWAARFEPRHAAGSTAQPWLHLQAAAQVACTCQRCLQPVPVALEVDRWFRFAPTEAEAAALDADSEDDVLALSRGFDLQALVEDELLMALPLVPRHEQCPQPLRLAPADADAPAANPFAALAALKSPPRP